MFFPAFTGIHNHDHAYFIHSYHLDLEKSADRSAYTEYGQKLTAAVIKENIAGTQFHPEKSQSVGLKFIRNFLLWRP